MFLWEENYVGRLICWKFDGFMIRKSFMLIFCVFLVVVVGVFFFCVMVLNGVVFYIVYKDLLNFFWCKLIIVLMVFLVVNDFLIGFVVSLFCILWDIVCDLVCIWNFLFVGSFENIIGVFVYNNGILFIVGLFVERLIVVVLLFYYCVMVSSWKMLICVVCLIIYFFVFFFF